MIDIEHILDSLVSSGGYAPSSMGHQLERMQLGISVPSDTFRARDESENAMLRQAVLLRTISEFSARKEFRERYETLKKIQRGTRPEMEQGRIAIAILRAYHERATRSKERGLVEVYRIIGGLALDVVPAPPASARDVDDVVQAFREGTAKRARAISAEAYADSYLALAQFLRVQNKKCSG